MVSSAGFDPETCTFRCEGALLSNKKQCTSWLVLFVVNSFRYAAYDPHRFISLRTLAELDRLRQRIILEVECRRTKCSLTVLFVVMSY